MEHPSKQNQDRIFRIYERLLHRTEARHLLPDTFLINLEVWKPKYLIIRQAHGLKQMITHTTIQSMYHIRPFYLIQSTIFRISKYAAVSTAESVFILGGIHRGAGISSNIVEYKDGNWNLIGNLMQGRYFNSAVNLGSSVMVVGGWRDTGRITSSNPEIWDMNSAESQTISPVISPHYWQVELFPIDVGFCSRN